MNRKSFLLVTLLLLAILAQVVILRWAAETVFFVTWLLLALIFKHESRVSAAVGLTLLATCPLLLIADKEPVAEMAASHAYFFLAIGVLVQVEELFLERRGWLERKVNVSHVWRPATRALESRWSLAVQAVEQYMMAADQTRLVRLVQIVGTAGLAAVFLWAASTGAPASIVLPLLGGALLFPFVIWGGQIAVRGLGAVWLLRAALALVVLPLAAAEMVWLYDLVSADRLAHMETTYDFVERLGEAERILPAPEGEDVGIRVWTVEDLSRWVLYQHPAGSGRSHVAYRVRIERATVLAFHVATAPESWFHLGDGVAFAVYVRSEQGAQQVFSTYIDPKSNEADRRWHSHTVDLSAYAGQTVTLIFETSAGPGSDARYDWAGWGDPCLKRSRWP
jgi:hypothetical protein